MSHLENSMTDFILASASPRRKELLKRMGYDFRVVPSDIREEKISKNSPLLKAQRKAENVYERYPDHLVVGADTVAFYENDILEKPDSEREAREMLSSLAGSEHSVVTGLSLVNRDKRVKDKAETKVRFAELSEKEIEWYVNTGEPFDKAGGYGIQGKAALFVKEIRGCYFNVVGFPLRLFYKLLDKISPADAFP